MLLPNVTATVYVGTPNSVAVLGPVALSHGFLAVIEVPQLLARGRERAFANSAIRT
jgi:hypothetical protein